MNSDKFPDYQVHPEVHLLPPMSAGERAALKGSLQDKGLLEPIVVFQGRIAEGLHRYEVARELFQEGVPLTILRLQFRELGAAELGGAAFRDWVLAKNCTRRHLSASQVAIVAAREYCQSVDANEAGQGKQRPQFAERFGVSERTLQDAITVWRSERMQLREAVFQGNIAIHAAVDELRQANSPFVPAEQSHEITHPSMMDRSVVEAISPTTVRGDGGRSKGGIVGNGKSHILRPSGKDIVDSLAELKREGVRFGTIYADPPWAYNNEATRGAATDHYPTMSVEALCQLPVAELAATDCHLHLWTTNAFLFDSLRVLEAWGFEYKSACIWVKPQMGLGNYWRVSHEFCLLGVRGSAPFASHDLMSWFQADRLAHSEKPPEMRARIEAVSQAPYLELFARRLTPGWTSLGNECEASDVSMTHSA